MALLSLLASAAVSKLGENTISWNFPQGDLEPCTFGGSRAAPNLHSSQTAQSLLLILSPKLGGQIQALFDLVPVLVPKPCPGIIWETTNWS